MECRGTAAATWLEIVEFGDWARFLVALGKRIQSFQKSIE